jgi:excisionase family DNA binding protein
MANQRAGVPVRAPEKPTAISSKLDEAITSRAELPRMLSTRKVAETFGRSLRTVRSWIAKGFFEPVRVGNAVFISKEQVDALLSRPRANDCRIRKKTRQSQLHARNSKSTAK